MGEEGEAERDMDGERGGGVEAERDGELNCLLDVKFIKLQLLIKGYFFDQYCDILIINH